MTTGSRLLAATLALSAAACAPDGPGEAETAALVEAPRLRQVIDPASESFLQEMMETERFTGVALVVRDGSVVHAKGYGAASEDRANTVDTAFHVASVTKQFTAAAVLQLAESGRVSLEASINEFLPETYRSARWDGVTVHHLLSHSGGVPDYAVTRPYYDVVKGFCLGDTVDGMVREAMEKELEFEPGARFEYSNIGFTLLGLAIEHVTRMPYEEVLQKNVLNPMGMTSSRVHGVDHVADALEAEGMRWSEEEGAHVPDDVVSLPVTAPDGGLITTLADFAAWAQIYLGSETSILTPESVERMTASVVPIPESDSDVRDARGEPQGYGYGLFVSDTLISHAGYIVGFRSHFVLDRDRRRLVAVFTNNTENDPSEIAAGLLAIQDAIP